VSAFAPPVVTVVRTGFDGTIYRQRLPAPDAVEELLRGAANGREYVRGHIEWGSELDNWPAGGVFAPGHEG